MKYKPDLHKMTKRENANTRTAGFRIIEVIFFLSAGLGLCTIIALGFLSGGCFGSDCIPRLASEH